MKQFHLKKTNLFSALLLVSSLGFSQNYTWMKGVSTVDQPGVYGTPGISSPANYPGGREIATSWKDASGNFWAFGGFGVDALGNSSMLNDLWKYNEPTNQWTYMKGDSISDQDGVYNVMGMASATSKPGGREGAVSWTDASGNLWMFGGVGFDVSSNIGEMNDLWKYNIATNQWAWMSGSSNGLQSGTYGTMGTAAASNVPGARVFPATWADASGNLWLFGGSGYDSGGNYGDLNDLWKYNIASGQWTWVNGVNGVDQSGIYGTLGTAAASNSPGGRYFSSTWTDASGNFWLCNGAGFDASTGSEDLLNDLWRYNVATNQWTWIKGSNVSAQTGVYGTQGVAAAGNVPGGRGSSVALKNSAGDILLFGGFGYISTNSDVLNDLWKYSPSTNQWTWMKGSNTLAPNGAYGTMGTPAAANTPGGRGGPLGWLDASDNLWLFSGFGNDASGSQGDLGDLWRLSNCLTGPQATVVVSNTATCLGGSFTLTASGASSYAWSNNQAGTVTVVSPTVSGAETILCYPADSYGCVGTITLNLNVNPLPTVIATSAKPAICKGATVTISASGATTYSWSNAPGYATQNISVSPTITTVYTVTGTDANGCSKTYSLTQTVNLCTGIESQTESANTYIVYPNPNNGAFTIAGQNFEPGTKLLVYNALGQKVVEESLESDQTSIQTQLQKGIYLYSLLQNDKKIGTGKLVIE